MKSHSFSFFFINLSLELTIWIQLQIFEEKYCRVAWERGNGVSIEELLVLNFMLSTYLVFCSHRLLKGIAEDSSRPQQLAAESVAVCELSCSHGMSLQEAAASCCEIRLDSAINAGRQEPDLAEGMVARCSIQLDVYVFVCVFFSYSSDTERHRQQHPSDWYHLSVPQIHGLTFSLSMLI